MDAPLNFLFRKFKSRQLIVLLSDFIDAINRPSSINWELIRTVAARHDVIALILHDADEFKWGRASGVITTRNPENRRLEEIKGSSGLKIREETLRKREELVRKLRQNGVGAMAINHDNYRSDLHGFFRSRKRVFR